MRSTSPWIAWVVIASLRLFAQQAHAAAATVDVSTDTARAAAVSPLVFRGNVVLNDEVYLAVLALPPNFAVDDAGARLVHDRLLAFLQRAGYELARVETAVASGRILVDLDEGRVEKLVLSGQGSLQTVRLLLTLSLPQNVFNRPYLERQLAAMRREYGVEVESFTLVPTGRAQHVGPQMERLGVWVDSIGNFFGHSLLPPRTDYELHIKFRRREWANGVGLSAGVSGISGLRLGLDLRGTDALFTDDRWLVGTRVEAKRRHRLVDDSAYGALEGARAQLGWSTPRLAGGVRPMLSLVGALQSYQRPDLNLESYTFTRTQLVLALSYDFLSGATIGLGLGAEHQDIFALRAVQGATLSSRVETSSTFVPYVGWEASIVFDADEIRRDHQHELKLDGRYYPGYGGSTYGVAGATYQRVLTFGWHELWLCGRGDYMIGSVPFVEEQAISGDYTRGVFGGRFYARRVVGSSLGLRFSLARDLYKAGLFADAALFGERDPTRDREAVRAAASMGPSFHVLIADAFQLDLYYALGVAADTRLDRGFVATLRQAF